MRLSLSPERLIFAAALLALAAGPSVPVERYVSPQSGLGYALGIIGGAMMLLLTVYPLRKRIRVLRFLGGIPQWFRAHMLLGVGGPICILFHCNFSLGAANSNVALVCMLIVAGSGVIGRYFYSRIHHGLYGRKATLAELQAKAQEVKGRETRLPLLPELMGRLEREEQHIMRASHGFMAPLSIAIRASAARRSVRGYVRKAVRVAAARSPVVVGQQQRIERAALEYAARRIRASRQVAEFGIYERLFSLWHVLHLPLFFMLLVTGIVHVVAVHVY